ncbi:MAG: long-chain fatty acid--CoA ligase [Ignavibacteriae bacterium]|nr:long-chain fatty acid--CoA ligase [Ignavibacteriota bacterium]
MILNSNSIFTSFFEALRTKSNSETILQYYSDGELKAMSKGEFLKKTICLNKALTDLRIQPKDRVGIISENRIEFLIADMATNSIGVINVPTFPNFTPNQQKFIFNDCDAKIIIVSNKQQLRNILKIRDELERLEYIIIMESGLEDIDGKILSMSKLIEEAERNYNYENLKSELLTNSRSIHLDDILTLIYTSGTTGNPKGVMLTNRNILTNVNSIWETGIKSSTDDFLSFLPMCHAYERTVIYTFLITGGVVTIAQSIESLSSNLNEVKPNIITAVPKLLETVQSKILNAIKNEKKAKKDLINKAMRLSISSLELDKIPLKDRVKLKVYDKLIFAKMRDKLGGRLKFIVSGGSALSPHVQKFFHSIGLTVIQGYGLTECSPVVSANTPKNVEIGTVGPPLNNVEVKIDNNGEILVRGDSVMKGYWHDDLATKRCIDDNNWFHTGDIGEFTKNGSLKITGRIKSLIVTSGGKNISPAPIEDMIRMSEYIEYIAIFGENKDYLTAIVSPNYEVLKQFALEQNIIFDSLSELIKNDKINKKIMSEINLHQESLAKFERVRKITIVENPFSIETGELTPKLSMKTSYIFEKYSNEIEGMYK